MRIFLIEIIIIATTICLTSSCQQQPYGQGKILYTNKCANCHGDNGEGLLGNIPPLAKADYLVEQQGMVPCIIRKGLQEPMLVNGKTYRGVMLPIPELTDFEITNIMNYINSSWGNQIPAIKLEEVQASLEKCE